MYNIRDRTKSFCISVYTYKNLETLRVGRDGGNEMSNKISIVIGFERGDSDGCHFELELENFVIFL